LVAVPTTCCAVSPTGVWLATGSNDGIVDLYYLDSGEKVASMEKHPGQVCRPLKNRASRGAIFVLCVLPSTYGHRCRFTTFPLF
jgi:WD40 repeat protein